MSGELARAYIAVGVDANAVPREMNTAVSAAKAGSKQIAGAMDETNKSMRNAGFAAGRFGFGLQQASFGVQDFVQVYGQTGLAGALRASVNNFSQVLAIVNPLAGALGGLALTVGGIYIANMLEGKKKTEETKDAVEELTEALKRARDVADIQISMSRIGSSKDAGTEQQRHGDEVLRLEAELAEIRKQGTAVFEKKAGIEAEIMRRGNRVMDVRELGGELPELNKQLDDLIQRQSDMMQKIAGESRLAGQAEFRGRLFREAEVSNLEQQAGGMSPEELRKSIAETFEKQREIEQQLDVLSRQRKTAAGTVEERRLREELGFVQEREQSLMAALPAAQRADQQHDMAKMFSEGADRVQKEREKEREKQANEAEQIRRDAQLAAGDPAMDILTRLNENLSKIATNTELGANERQKLSDDFRAGALRSLDEDIKQSEDKLKGKPAMMGIEQLAKSIQTGVVDQERKKQIEIANKQLTKLHEIKTAIQTQAPPTALTGP